MNKKKLITIAIILVAAFVIIATLIPMIVDFAGKPVSKTKTNVPIVIAQDTSTLSVGKTLENNDLIRSRYAFFLQSKFGKYRPITPGSYVLSPTMTMDEILKEITKIPEPRKSVSVTFPEGYTIEQMGELLEEKGVVSEADFIAALDETYSFAFLENIPHGDYNYKLQGFLFPSTYEFYLDSEAKEVVGRMLAMFNEVYLANADTYENVFEVVTKASMVEKEAKLAEERPIIAGVFENRLSVDMPLQVDASILYAATNGKFDNSDSSYIADRIANLDSPYNTYKYAGLPVGPICNPGLAAIQAVLKPEEHNYYYYHTDTSKDDGSHIFSETYGGHLSTM